jgi:hypothetical protein
MDKNIYKIMLEKGIPCTDSGFSQKSVFIRHDTYQEVAG